MIGTITIVWKGPGVLKDKGKVVAGPGEKIYVDSITAEAHVRAGVAHYPRR
jgi:hypothetical protein